MAKLPIIIISLLTIALQTQFFPGEGWTFTLVNNCSYTVWPAAATSSIGFSLERGESQVLDLGSTKDGKLWGRTQCDNSTGKFACKTGDCGRTDCFGSNTSILNATTLFEFTHGLSGDDLYDLSLVDGYNLPILVVPQSPGCSATGCIFNVDQACPRELKFGSTCRSPCEVFETAEYCCTGATTCHATNYSRIFKKACPRAYSYALDDDGDTYSCKGAPAYTITFCPSPRAMTRPSIVIAVITANAIAITHNYRGPFSQR